MGNSTSVNVPSDLLNLGFITDSPTTSPTSLPTISPSILPTNSPTSLPIHVPTSSPTNFPSTSPVLVPDLFDCRVANRPIQECPVSKCRYINPLDSLYSSMTPTRKQYCRDLGDFGCRSYAPVLGACSYKCLDLCILDPSCRKQVKVVQKIKKINGKRRVVNAHVSSCVPVGSG